MGNDGECAPSADLFLHGQKTKRARTVPKAERATRTMPIDTRSTEQAKEACYSELDFLETTNKCK
jgi:hypothetical protein